MLAKCGSLQPSRVLCCRIQASSYLQSNVFNMTACGLDHAILALQAPDASLLRPVSSARRERSTNPFASLQEESDEEDNTTSLDKGSQAPISSVWGRGFAGFQFSSGGSAQAGEASSSENRAGSGGTVHFAAVRDDIDPDL